MGGREDLLPRQDRRRRRRTQGTGARHGAEKARYPPVRASFDSYRVRCGSRLTITRACITVRLQAASEDYHHVLSKKKESPSSGEAEKLMPLDALGIVMVTHGEEYGDDSAFGECRSC